MGIGISRLAGLLALSLGALTEAIAGSPEDDNGYGISIYPASYFANLQAQTAFDLIGRLPGFSFTAGNDDLRGYSGSSGNVLIDGQWPASKYESLENILRRIPASAVDRVELIRGASPGIDMQGHMVVANIVRDADAAVEARIEFGVYLQDDRHMLPEGRIEASRRWDSKTLEGSFHAYEIADDDSGAGRRKQTDMQGNIIRDGYSEFVASDKGSQTTIGYEQPLAGGGLRLNAVLVAEHSDEREYTDTIVPTLDRSVVTERKNVRLWEFGARYERSLGRFSNFEALVIQQNRSTREEEREISGVDDAAFTKDSTAGESIFRAALQFIPSNSLSFEWGTEFAFNFLDNQSTSAINGIPVLFPAADVRVEERRAEPYGRATWQVQPQLSLEAGAAVEYSRISQSGDNELSKSLSYVKPDTRLTWTASPMDQLRLRVHREVSQLDFDDFVSSAEFSTETLDAGNANLEPYSAWQFEASWDRKLTDDASIVLTLRHAKILDVIDTAPIYVDTDGDGVVENFEGPGNIGGGRKDEAEIDLTLALDRFGIGGGLLKGKMIYRETAATDPLTGETRSISDVRQPREGELAFTQDRPSRHFRWGMEVRFGTSKPEFRIDEIRNDSEQTWLGIFAEFFPAPTWSVTVSAQNLTGRATRLRRTLYSAPRDLGSVEAIDTRARVFEPYINVHVRWQLR